MECAERAWPAPRRRAFGFPLAVAAITLVVTLLFSLTTGSPPVGGARYETPGWAVAIHLGTVGPALILGGLLLVRRKGGASHIFLGRLWMALMVTTAVVSFWIRSPAGTLSAIHLFSAGVLIAVPVSIWRIRARDVGTHRRIQVSLYIGLIVAGLFTLTPDRALGSRLWAEVARLAG